jgi:hypothetical protein
VDEAIDDALARYPAVGAEDTDQEYDVAVKLSRQFFRHGEYCTVELDTDTQTCTVVKADKE